MRCPLCSPNGEEPRVVILDGTANSFNRKKATGSLRPPTYVDRTDPTWPVEVQPSKDKTDVAIIERSLRHQRDILRRIVPSSTARPVPPSPAELDQLSLELPAVSGILALREVRSLDPAYKSHVDCLLKQVSSLFSVSVSVGNRVS